MFDRATATATMIADARAFYAFGWMLGTSGNLSIRRDADTFLITASGKDKGRLAEDDFLLCDLDGQPVEETANRPSAETLVHCAVYRKFGEAGAVYHVHEPFAALCSARDADDKETAFRELEMIKGLDVWAEEAQISVPIVPNYFDIPTLAVAIDEVLDDLDVPAVNIRHHGFYAWGVSPFEAKRHVESLAYLYRYSWEASR